MKKLVLFIVMFLFVGNVYAKDITLDDVVNVINDGVITEEFKESKLLELDDKTIYISATNEQEFKEKKLQVFSKNKVHFLYNTKMNLYMQVLF